MFLEGVSMHEILGVYGGEYFNGVYLTDRWIPMR